MRSIKINRKTLPSSYKTVVYEEVKELAYGNEEYKHFNFKCKEMHALSDGDVIVFTLNREGKYPIAHAIEVEVVDKYSFNALFPLYYPMDVCNYSMEGDNALLVLKNAYINNYVRDNQDITLKYGEEIFQGKVEVTENNEEDLAAEAIMCDKPLDFVGEGFVVLLCDWFLDGETFDTSIVLEDRNISLDISLAFDNADSYGLGDEQQSVNEYFDDVLGSIVPEIVDNEKRQFSPVIETGYNENVFRLASEIEFNLHFRDRTDLDENDGRLTEEWKTSDSQYWNNMSINEGYSSDTESDDSLRYKTLGYDDTFADELNCLGFTEDDIKFSKTKIKRSFLRLSFYSTNSVLARDLLCYSTIFFDSGEFFKKYTIIKGKGLPCFDSKRIDDSLRLSAKLRVVNQYNNSKSSEGFYLYLFPDDVGVKNSKKTIYMKVEFNHAGYGKTVPLMIPRNSMGNLIKGTDKEFPLNFLVKQDGKIGPDFKKYERCMMIPVNVWYDEDLGEYVYTFPFVWGEKKIKLNLFEPRILGFEE